MRQSDRIIVNTLANYGLIVVELVAALVMVPTVVGHLGKSGYGLASLVLAVLGMVLMLSNAAGRALHRYIPLHRSTNDIFKMNQIFNNGLLELFGIGLLGGLGVAALVRWFVEGADVSPQMLSDAKLAFWLLAGWLAVGSAAVTYQYGLESLQRYDLVSFYNSTATVVRTISIIALFMLGYGSIWLFILFHLVGQFVAAVLCRRALFRLAPEFLESFRFLDLGTLRMIAVFGAGTMVILIGNMMSGQGFRIFVGKSLSVSDLGTLAAALTIANMMWKLVYSLANVVAPVVSTQDAQGSMTNINKLLVAGTKYSVGIAVTMCLVPITAAPPFFHLWLGDEFTGMDALVFVLLIGQIPHCLTATAQQVLLGLGRLRFITPVMFARGAVGLLAAYLYVRFVSPSLTGAAACLFAVQGIGGLIVFVYSSVSTQSKWPAALFEAFLRPILLGMAGMLTTWAIQRQLGDPRWWTLGVAVAGGEVVFLALMALLGLKDDERLRFTFFAGTLRARLAPLLRRRRPEQP